MHSSIGIDSKVLIRDVSIAVRAAFALVSASTSTIPSAFFCIGQIMNHTLNAMTSAFLAKPARMLIGGKWVDSVSGKTFATLNPATGEKLGEVPSMSEAEAFGREEIRGIRYYALELTLDDGFKTRYFVDPSSFLVTRCRVHKALHPDNDPTPTTIETVWSDFRPVAGVLFPFEARDTDLATGKLLQTTTLLEMAANRPVDDEFFQVPKRTGR